MGDGIGAAFVLPIIVVVCSLCVAVPALVIINAWLIDKTIEFGTACIGLCALLGAFALIIKFFGQPLSFIVLALLVGTCLLSPRLANRWEKRGLARMDEEDIDKYLLAIASDPKNAAARSALAKVYRKQTRYDEAIEQLQKALEAYPNEKDKRLLQRVVDEQQRAEAEGPICPACRAINPPGADVCGGCDRPFKQPGFLGWAMQPQNLKRLSTASALVLVIVTVCAGLLSLLPRPVVLSLMFVGVASVAVYYWWRL